MLYTHTHHHHPIEVLQSVLVPVYGLELLGFVRARPKGGAVAGWDTLRRKRGRGAHMRSGLGFRGQVLGCRF
jgi:hypothetical protein